VYAVPEATTFKRAINGSQMNVISLHHQMVKRPGKGMRIAARAANDGTVEAIESKDGLWLGCQFHPEMAVRNNGNAFAIFQWLVRKAAEVAGGVAEVPTFKEMRRARVEWNRSWEEQKAKAVRSVLPAKNRVAGSSKYGSPYLESSATWEDLRAKRAAPEMQFLCPTCAMVFDYRVDRDDHVLVLHEGVAVADLPGIHEDEVENVEQFHQETVEESLGRIERAYPELTPPIYVWDDEDHQYVMTEELSDEELSQMDR
jgi:hypothetical protein